MSGKSKRNFRAFKTEETCIDKWGDVFVRAPLQLRAKAVASLLEVPPGWNLDQAQRALLFSAGELGLALPDEHQATYAEMKAESVKRKNAIATGSRNYHAAKAQAKLASSQRNEPAHGKPSDVIASSSEAPGKTIMEKLADFATPEPRDPAGWRGPMPPRPVSTALPSGSSSSEAPHPLRSLPPKPNS